jgi:hypothetical protein
MVSQVGDPALPDKVKATDKRRSGPGNIDGTAVVTDIEVIR